MSYRHRFWVFKILLYKRVRLSESDDTIKFYNTSTPNPDSNPQDIAIFRNPGGAVESLIIADLGTKSVLRISLYDDKRESIPDDNKVVVNHLRFMQDQIAYLF